MNKKLLIIPLLIFVVAFSFFAALNFVRAQTIPCTVYVDPAKTTVNVCTSFLINVNIANLIEPPIYHYDFFLTYDSSMMTPLNAWDGGFLEPPLVGLFWEIEPDYGGLGIDAVHCWAMTEDGGAVGSGTLATIEFHCNALGSSFLDLDVMLMDGQGVQFLPETVVGGWVIQGYWEPVKLIDIVEWPYQYFLVDIPFVIPSSPEGYTEVLSHIEAKGYQFDDPATGTASEVTILVEEQEITGTVSSWWSSNTLEDGTRACMLSAEMDDGTSMAMAFVTNLLPPEQTPEVDPYIIVNAMPYMYVRFYWWAWGPIGRVIVWPCWWYDSHHHPNWFWGPFWWWRIYIRGYYYPYDVVPYWRPWWGWWWHWIYWRHWYWWSTYFPYDP